MAPRGEGTGRKLLPRAERAASIRQAAARAFARAGFAGTSMDDVAREAGVTKIIVYRHYDTKKDLYYAVLDATCEALKANADPSPEGLRGMLRVARQDPDGFTLLYRHAAREPEFASYAAEYKSASIDYAEDFLRDGVPDPTLRRWLCRAVVEMTTDAILAWLEDGDPDKDDMAAEALFQAARGMVSAAIGTVA